jgi:hypothetical protein
LCTAVGLPEHDFCGGATDIMQVIFVIECGNHYVSRKEKRGK